MAYMLMLVINDIEQLDAILKAWEKIHVDDIVFMDSTCFHRAGRKQQHIPMRFMFERSDGNQRQCSVTLFGLVNDEEVLQQCMREAETVIGDFDAAPNAMLAAWPLTIVKGFPKPTRGRGEPAS